MSEISEWVIQSVKYIQIVDFLIGSYLYEINARLLPLFMKTECHRKSFVSMFEGNLLSFSYSDTQFNFTHFFTSFCWNDYFSNLMKWKMSLILKYSIWWGKAATCQSSLTLNLKFIVGISAFLEQQIYINYCPDLGD